MKYLITSGIFMLIFTFTAPLSLAQVEYGYTPWPYDSLWGFSYLGDPALQDSVFSFLKVYNLDAEGYINSEIKFLDSTATDTSSVSQYFRDADQRDTLILNYSYLNGVRSLCDKQQYTYHPNAERESWVRTFYSKNPPYQPLQKIASFYDTLGQEYAKQWYNWENGAFSLNTHVYNLIQDTLIIERLVYSNFFSLPDTVLAQRTRWFYDAMGLRTYWLHESRNSPNSSLQLSDSLHYSFDNQDRWTKQELYAWDLNNQAWVFAQKDTFEYTPDQTTHTSFFVSNGQLRPGNRAKDLDTDLLRTLENEIWLDSCQCWWRNRLDSTIFDTFGRKQEAYVLSANTPSDSSFSLSQTYSYFGNQPYLKYTFESSYTYSNDQYSSSSTHYSLRDAVISSTESAFELSIALFPNPTSGLIQLLYPSGKMGSVKIYQSDGRLMLEEKLDLGGSWQGELSAYPAGLYFIELQQDSKRSVKQFILTR